MLEAPGTLLDAQSLVQEQIASEAVNIGEIGCGEIFELEDDERSQQRRVRSCLEGEDLAPAHFGDNGGWGLTVITALSAPRSVTLLPSSGKIVWAGLKP